VVSLFREGFYPLWSGLWLKGGLKVGAVVVSASLLVFAGRKNGTGLRKEKVKKNKN